MAEHILQVLDRNAEHAAAMAHCRVDETWVARSRPGLTNHALAQALYANLEEVGAPQYGPDAVAVAQSIQRELGLAPMDRPFLEECQSLITPQDAERGLREHLAPWQLNWTSDDYVEMTHYAPTVRFYISRPALKQAQGEAPYPAWVMNALGGIPATIDPTIDVAGKTISGTFIDLLTDPSLLSDAAEEFARRKAGRGCAPLLPASFEPPINVLWPEYVRDREGQRRWLGTADV